MAALKTHLIQSTDKERTENEKTVIGCRCFPECRNRICQRLCRASDLQWSQFWTEPPKAVKMLEQRSYQVHDVDADDHWGNPVLEVETYKERTQIQHCAVLPRHKNHQREAKSLTPAMERWTKMPSEAFRRHCLFPHKVWGRLFLLKKWQFTMICYNHSLSTRQTEQVLVCLSLTIRESMQH